MLNAVSTQFLDEYCQAVAKAGGVLDALSNSTSRL